MATYTVAVTLEIEADDDAQACALAHELLAYADEVANDEETMKSFDVGEATLS